MLGDAPNSCNRKPEDCAYFGMTMDTKHPQGVDGEWCNGGNKIRCLAPEPPVSKLPSPANVIRVASHNVFERAFFITADGQRERTCRVPYIYARDYSDIDVIVFQEVFMGGCWPEDVSVRDLLTYYGYPYLTETLHSDLIWKVENGGIFIASKWPIIEEDQHIFVNSDPESWDFVAAKGVAYAKVNKTVDGKSQIFHVMGTHFQAGSTDDIQYGQAKEWSDFMTSKNIPKDEPVIYAGDLNADVYREPDHFFSIMDILQASLPELVGEVNGTIVPGYNDILNIRNKTGPAKWIDHVVYSNLHKVLFIMIIINFIYII